VDYPELNAMAVFRARFEAEVGDKDGQLMNLASAEDHYHLARAAAVGGAPTLEQVGTSPWCLVRDSEGVGPGLAAYAEEPGAVFTVLRMDGEDEWTRWSIRLDQALCVRTRSNE
jgi:hypothetical protein